MEPHRLALPPGFRIENYEIQAVLGKGGFGITYVAYDWTLKRHMAIKELLPDTIATRIEGSTVVAMGPSHEEGWAWAKERFVEEAQILAGFHHPNIIAVHRLIEANGTVYLVMDHLEGESYEARMRRIGSEPDEASLMAVVGPILDGLQEVHAKGLLHRDIKPENILFDGRGNAVLIDFGAARATVGATMTMTSIVTHGYSPIEQYQTEGKMGPWTDIYAMAAVMCRSITGEKPHVASDRLMGDDFVWLSNRGLAEFDEKFLAAVDWALRVRPEDRPKSIPEWSACFVGALPSKQSKDDSQRQATHISEPISSVPILPLAKRKPHYIQIAIFAAIALICALFGYSIWPTIYRYDHTKLSDDAYVVRIHRFSGLTEMLVPNRGWIQISGANSKAKDPRPLSEAAMSKLDGTLSVSRTGWLEADIYNGTQERLGSILVQVRVKDKSGDIVLSRSYRLTSTGGEPYESSKYIGSAGLTLKEGQELEWSFLSAEWR